MYSRLMTISLLTTLFTLMVIVSGVQAQDEMTTCPPDFAGYLSPQQIVGQHARTVPGSPLNLRPEPGTALARIGVIPGGVTLPVLDGPRCNEGYVWWQVAYDEQTGWVAEGNPDDGEYWIESRGILLTLDTPDGETHDFVLYDDDILERAECLPPPDDYTREQIGFATLNERTLAMLDHAQRIYEANGGQLVNFRQGITQGSYNAGGVAASFGTHDGGGAVDLSVRSVVDWSVMTTEIQPMLRALRLAGFAAWLRDTSELYVASPIHIHAIAVGDAELSPAARRQIDGPEGYLRGYNGLPVEDYSDDGQPLPDGYGEPVICRWMILQGFDDLRERDHFQAGLDYQQAGYAYYAIDSFSRSLRLNGDDPGVLRARGDTYYMLERYEAALADYRLYSALVDEPDAEIQQRITELAAQ